MSKDRRCRQAKKTNRAPNVKSKWAASSPNPASNQDVPPTRKAESVSADLKSIDDVARLFIGVDSGSRVGKVYMRDERIGAQLRKETGSTKRPREDANNGTTKEPSQAKRPKSSVITSVSPTATNTTIVLKRKAIMQPGPAKHRENVGDDEEDVELSKAVQSQTLSFLQHLNASSRKIFWGLRDAAQGKPSAAAAATAAALPASSFPSSSRKQAAKRSAIEAKKLADDGEELWRVGGPYIPRDSYGDTDESDEERGATSDCESQGYTSSSEPTWVTDSSEEEDDGSEDKNSDDTESAPVATGAARQRRTTGPPKRGGSGGGRLFQGGSDGVWDED